MAKSVAQIVQSIKRGTGKGGVFDAKQVKPYLDKNLQEAADYLKEFIMETIEVNRQHKIRRDGDGLWKNTISTLTTDGGKLQVPQYAEALDTGRAPGLALVPLDDIIRWIKRYRVLGRVKSTGVYKKVSAESVNSAAYAIQRGIYKNGIIARPWLETVLGFQDVLVASLVDEIMLPEIVSVLDYTFKDKK